MGYRGVQRGTEGYQEIPRSTKRHQEVARVTRRYQGMPRGTRNKKRYLGVSICTAGYREVLSVTERGIKGIKMYCKVPSGTTKVLKGTKRYPSVPQYPQYPSLPPGTSW